MQEFETELTSLAPFADIMDNISKQHEIEHVDSEYIDYLKQTQVSFFPRKVFFLKKIDQNQINHRV